MQQVLFSACKMVGGHIFSMIRGHILSACKYFSVHASMVGWMYFKCMQILFNACKYGWMDYLKCMQVLFNACKYGWMDILCSTCKSEICTWLRNLQVE